MVEMLAANYEQPISPYSKDKSATRILPNGRVIVVDYETFLANMKATLKK